MTALVDPPGQEVVSDKQTGRFLPVWLRWLQNLRNATQLLDVLGATQGNVLYRNASQWTVLAPGTSGQFLKTLGAAANPTWDAAGGATPHAPGGRVTLTTALPVTIADVTAAATVYYTPTIGDLIPIYSGSWAETTFAQLSLALDSDAGHAGYHQSGKNFDLWVYNDGGTLRLGTGAAWTNDTTRSDAVVMQNGITLNNATMTLRYGSAAGNTVSVAASRATLVGSMRATANGQTEDSFAKRFISNYYNDVPRPMRVMEATDAWSYATTTIRQANGSAANQLDFICTKTSAPIYGQIIAMYQADTAGGYGSIGFGLDVTNAFTTGGLSHINQAEGAANPYLPVSSAITLFPGLGRHFLSWNERGGGVGVVSWKGDAGLPTLGFQSGIHGWVMG